MLLLVVVCALLLIQIWGSGAPLHRDQWFYSLLAKFNKNANLAAMPLGTFCVVLVLACVAVLLVSSLLADISGWLSAVFGVLVLVYSMGRGQFSEPAKDYISAWQQKDWQAAVKAAHRVDVNDHDIEPDDWSELNHSMVSALAYRGFERIFTVLFWYALAGVVGALAYRLIALFTNYTESPKDEEWAQRLLWYLEWPVARLFGLSLAVTGNFASCFTRFQQYLTCAKTSTQELLVYFVESSLNVTASEALDARCGEKELTELLQLYSRTMVLWLCVIAVVTLVV